MLNKLIQAAMQARLLVMLFVAGLIGSGIYAVQNLPIDAFPDVSSTQVKIIIKSPGLTPEEIEARITAPVEVEMLGIPKQTMLRAVAKYGLTEGLITKALVSDIKGKPKKRVEELKLGAEILGIRKHRKFARSSSKIMNLAGEIGRADKFTISI